MSSLLVIIPFSLTEVAKKGEITPRYFNPGNFFDAVHILSTTSDFPESDLIRPMVGKAKLFLHNLPVPSIKATLGWNKLFLGPWVNSGVEYVKAIRPDLVRCHGDELNAYLASEIKRQLGIPFVVSLHTYLDDKAVIHETTRKQKLIQSCLAPLRRQIYQEADAVLPVYESIIPYVKRFGARNIQVKYNVINPEYLREKSSYELHQPVRILNVGRQAYEKNPEQIIRAVEGLEGVELTVIGNGPYHENLKSLTKSSRVQFIQSLPNEEICKRLPEVDIFAFHCELLGISKCLLEPLLTGVPCVVNKLKSGSIPEYEGDYLLLVDNSQQSFQSAFVSLIQNAELREKMGRKAREVSQARWSPSLTERAYSQIYSSVLNHSRESAVGEASKF